MESSLSGQLNLPSSHELGVLFQDEFAAATGLAVRWTAERLQGNRAGFAEWTVPFSSDRAGAGAFKLCWDPEIARSLSLRLGPSSARPEFLGAILRSAAGRWASWQAMRAGSNVRLQPTLSSDENALGQAQWTCSAVLLLDSMVMEVSLQLDRGPLPLA